MSCISSEVLLSDHGSIPSLVKQQLANKVII